VAFAVGLSGLEERKSGKCRVDTATVQVWSREFFSDVAEKISFR